MAAPIIQGGLPWGGGGASMDFSGSPAGLANSYANAYNSALAMNQQNYNNILAGYQQTAGQQNAAQDAITQGYGNLSADVLGGIRGIGASQAQAIRDQYAQLSGQASQGLISRGLGNTTVADSVQRGLSYDQAKANVNLANQIAGLTAGYQSQLGLAGLNYLGQAAQNNTALGLNQLNWMNSVNAGYPNAGLYAQLAQTYGAGQQANADRALAQQGLDYLRQGAGGFVPAGTTSYSPGGSALTGRPSAGAFGPGSAPGSALGGTGATYAYPGNYLGMGVPQAVNAAGTDYLGAAQSAALGGAYGGLEGYEGSLADAGYGYDFSDNPDYLAAAQQAALGGAYGGLAGFGGGGDYGGAGEYLTYEE